MKCPTINRIPLVLFLLSLVAIGVGYVLLRNPQLLGLCPADAVRNCLSEFWKFGFGESLFHGIRILPLVFFVLVFVPKTVVRAWAWLAVPYALVALTIVSMVPPIGNMFSPDRVAYVQFFSYLFAALSLLIILIRYALLKWRGK